MAAAPKSTPNGKPRRLRGTWDTTQESGLDRGPRKRPVFPASKTLWGKPQDPHDNLKGLKRDYTFPPFSVLRTDDGLWQSRKRLWLGLGIKSEIGRGETIEIKGGKFMLDTATPYGCKTHTDDTSKRIMAAGSPSGVSIFDPVLCELMYKWFCPPGGKILDPFAGGSVRGIVAAVGGHPYHGIDLSGKQLAANREQALVICTPQMPVPVWEEGDSAEVLRMMVRKEKETFDFILSCPPYANLEVYSTHPKDISNMDYPAFLAIYRGIIRTAALLLKPNRFVAWVVGEARDREAHGRPYYGLVPDTIRAFADAGLAYYNEAMLVTAIGSLPLRSRKVFRASRKLGRGHQNVLIFCKGDPIKAALACGAGRNKAGAYRDQAGD